MIPPDWAALGWFCAVFVVALPLAFVVAEHILPPVEDDTESQAGVVLSPTEDTDTTQGE
jgi:hypothetical protein